MRNSFFQLNFIVFYKEFINEKFYVKKISINFNVFYAEFIYY